MTDYLTCGQCLREFPLHRITGFIQHKKLDCDDIQDASNKDTELQCNYCPQGFMTAWGLLIHAQLTHNLKIFLEKASETFLKQTQLSVHSFLPPCTDRSCLSKNAANMDFNKNSSTVEAEAILFENESIGNYHSAARKASADLAVNNSYVPNSISGLMDSSSNVSKGQTIASVSDCTTRDINVGLNANSKDNLVQFDLASTNKNTKAKTVEVVKSTSLKNQFSASIYPIRFANVTIPADAAVDTSRLQSSCSVSLIPAKNVSEKNSSFKITAATGNPDSSLMLPMASIKLPTMGNISTADSVSGPPASTVDFYSPAKASSLISSSNSLNSLSLTSVTNSRESFDIIHQSVGDTMQKAGDVQSCLLENPKGALTSDTDISSADITELAETWISNMDITETEKNCCDNQGCGITVIPGSHEDLKECCNAVVPKKRKRHMELKHMPFSRSRLASRRLLYRSIAANSTRSVTSQYLGKSGGTIYIDVEPESLSSNANANACGGGTALTVTQSTEEDNMLAPGLCQGAQSKQHSLILQPGAVFSIPFTYTMPTSVSISRPSCINMPNTAITSMLDSKSLDSKSGMEAHGGWKITSLLEKTESGLQGSGTGVAMEGVSDNDNLGRYSQSKPFQCEKCTMAFNQRIHLKKHMSKHTGIKPYKCDECNYSTVERSHLKVHIRIHTGEKPFKCTYCEYATAQNSTLKIHLKRHHGGKMFQCHSCDKKFTQERQLRGHEWEHGNKPDSQLD